MSQAAAPQNPEPKDNWYYAIPPDPLSPCQAAPDGRHVSVEERIAQRAQQRRVIVGEVVHQPVVVRRPGVSTQLLREHREARGRLDPCVCLRRTERRRQRTGEATEVTHGRRARVDLDEQRRALADDEVETEETVEA